MSNERNKNFVVFGGIAAAILLAILGGYLVGPEALELVINILKAAGLILLGLTILVTVHELGHFLTAKAFGMRVETFSIGFPPKLIGFTKGETEYVIGVIPLGGYVKISGIIDESLDTNHIKEAPKPYEFRAKPVWQRLIVMTGGVIMNVILGVFIFSMFFYSLGESKTPVSEMTYGIDVVTETTGKNECDEEIKQTTLGHFLGFQSGDKLLSFKGESLPYLEDYVDPNILLDDGAYFEVERSGKTVKIEVPDGILNQFTNDTIIPYLFSINMPSSIRVLDSSLLGYMTPALDAGLKTGDRIIAIDSQPVQYYSDLLKRLPTYPNQALSLDILRDGDSVSVVVQMDSTAKLGVGPDSVFLAQLKRDTLSYGFFDSFAPGFKRATSIVGGNAKGLGQVVTGQASARKSFIGPLAIAKKYLEIFTAGGWGGFLELTAILSMILAFVNILPIPALDGGHVVFLLIEAVIRKEPSVKIRIITQQIGMFFILGLMLLILFNDFFTHLLSNCA